MSLRLRSSVYGGVPEWPKGTDCKSAASSFGGSNPPSSTIYEKSELLPYRECVRIFHFYQGYFLLMFIPGGFFILRVFLLFAHLIPDRSPATMIAENH